MNYKAANWFKAKIRRDTESTIKEVRRDPFEEDWKQMPPRISGIYRLARFGKAFLDERHLIQVIYSNASYFRLSVKTRDLMLLEEIGTFVVPTTTATIPSLFATDPTLLVAKAVLSAVIYKGYYYS
ncbi:hypothetical protein BX616_002870 [Lobosporangium transversale]|uniref:Uncharacterized protein n=1 Tax=Lobosporangium transversale TaxID=64571 RepID=A0A1Y2G8K0_9FUNG|nr:hypothetical protein BCR41DRAFT_401166 [Lobosporangium transversale]KAF9899723.1 hypothetical protein BX616_002870 [Lobosporangium transversale]ORZ04315.1 hypothetical protein BCR41DRAFT_401166 [Lobosporangium transversale]|eukprot:XP_021876473.1 hypothetical protein BCR41DRAFT_401166 [Lobosporangium transversale]